MIKECMRGKSVPRYRSDATGRHRAHYIDQPWSWQSKVNALEKRLGKARLQLWDHFFHYVLHYAR